MWAAVAFVVVCMVLAWPGLIIVGPVLAFRRAQDIEKDYFGPMARAVGQRVRFKYVDARVPNAISFGLLWWKTVVIDRSLLELMTAPQLCAIVAHELGHHARKHLWQAFLLNSIGCRPSRSTRLAWEYEADAFAADLVGLELMICTLQRLAAMCPNDEELARRIALLDLARSTPRDAAPTVSG